MASNPRKRKAPPSPPKSDPGLIRSIRGVKATRNLGDAPLCTPEELQAVMEGPIDFAESLKDADKLTEKIRQSIEYLIKRYSNYLEDLKSGGMARPVYNVADFFCPKDAKQEAEVTKKYTAMQSEYAGIRMWLEENEDKCKNDDQKALQKKIVVDFAEYLKEASGKANELKREIKAIEQQKIAGESADSVASCLSLFNL